ncbi:MAG: Histidine kinase [Nocardioides sp.]|nr:Histidine kinase [Nocardioides sp.]
MELAPLYRDIVEKSPDGIWVFDLEGRTLYANPALRQLFGVDEEQMTRLTVFDSLNDLGKTQFAAHLEDVRAGRINEHDVESMFVRQDGSSLWVTVSESELRGPDGSVTGILHRLSDYNDRRLILDELTTSRRRLAEAQRIARIGSWEWDVERDEIWGSDELSALYGLDPDSFPAPYASFLDIVHEEDRGAVDAEVHQALEDGGEFVFVARVQASDDQWVWTRGRGVAHTDETGRVVSMSGTHQDITETKQAEVALEDQVRQNALMQAVASAANEAQTLADVLSQAQHLVLLHDDWERGRAFLPDPDGPGVVPLHLTEEDAAADLATPAESALELALANRAFAARASVWDDAMLTIGFPVSYADEVVAVVTIRSAPPLYRFDMIQSMVEQVAVQLGRVAERERAQRELADARDGAMEASRQKSEFLATMSHEIRTPLNGVIGLNDLLLRTGLDADQLRLASGVQVASRALLSVINDILDFSKIEAGKLELERLDFEIRPVFDQVASLLAETARAKGIELMVSCHPDVPEVLAGDPTRLAQVLTNLGSNAVKFTDGGEVYIRATAEPLPEGRVRLRVTVADTGIGVSEVDVETLFEAFTQADASTTRRFGGTGLGLAISREIVDALGGEIGLEPNPGGGSIFWFTAEFDAPSGPAVDPDDEYARSWLAGRRVLVVDDNAHYRLILEEQLAWWRVRSATAAGADQAEAAVAEAAATGDPFEGVLLDLSMPGRDGLALARALRENPAYGALRLVMLTSATNPDPDELEAAGIVECLVKPVLAADMRGALLRQLAGVGPRPTAQPRAAAALVSSRRVLVVEDNPVNQLVAVGLLEALGYTAQTADDGIEALEALTETTYDAVLMDVQMPRMDGYAATRAIRAAEDGGRRLPVIAMTAAAVEGERERCMAAGMDDFLTKPVDPSALAAVLDLWMPDGEPAAARTLSLVPTPPPPDPELLDGLARDRLDELRDLDPGNTTYLDRAIGNFIANTPGTLETIRAAADAGDVAGLKQVSHKLAGGALNLGVTAAGRTAQEIELLADTGTTEGATPLVDRLEADLARGREALQAYQATYSG